MLCVLCGLRAEDRLCVLGVGSLVNRPELEHQLDVGVVVGRNTVDEEQIGGLEGHRPDSAALPISQEEHVHERHGVRHRSMHQASAQDSDVRGVAESLGIARQDDHRVVTHAVQQPAVKIGARRHLHPETADAEEIVRETVMRERPGRNQHFATDGARQRRIAKALRASESGRTACRQEDQDEKGWTAVQGGAPLIFEPANARGFSRASEILPRRWGQGVGRTRQTPGPSLSGERFAARRL